MANIELKKTPLFFESSIVSYWRFEGNSNDEKGSNNGTDTAITYNSGNGKFDQGAGFSSGSSSKILIAHASNINLGATTDNYTVGFWLKTSTSPTNAIAIVSKYEGGAGLYPFAFNMRTGGDAGKMDFALYDGSANPTTSLTSALNDDNWHLIIGVRNTVTDKIYMYVDGAEVSNTADTTTISIANSSRINLGKDEINVGTEYYTGALDDLFICTRALSAREISALYNNSFPRAGFFLRLLDL